MKKETKNRAGFHDVLEFVERVSNQETLSELQDVIAARKIYLKYFNGI